MKRIKSREVMLCTLLCIGVTRCRTAAQSNTATSQPAFAPATIPGIVIAHSPKTSKLYIGSPSIVILPSGDYLASHDLFGPKSDELNCPTTMVYRSSDHGLTWKQVARLQCLFWPGLFVHKDAVYLMGADKQHGRVVIRCSTDSGTTWTQPRDRRTGLLSEESKYHTAPMPVLMHNGRLWRAMEDASNGTKWGERYMAGMLSSPVDADLLDADSWTFSNFVPRDPSWLNGEFGGWLEGNAVAAPDGGVIDMLRVETPHCPEMAAIVHISPDGKKASFDPATGFVQMPGGAKKFTIRFDPKSRLYWSIASPVIPEYEKINRPGAIRNVLTLISSPDLRQWSERQILLSHPDPVHHGFQYVDWQFDGDDIIAACRTAYDDESGGAHNYHDANYMTFHRIRDFRHAGPAK